MYYIIQVQFLYNDKLQTYTQIKLIYFRFLKKTNKKKTSMTRLLHRGCEMKAAECFYMSVMCNGAPGHQMAL